MYIRIEPYPVWFGKQVVRPRGFEPDCGEPVHRPTLLPGYACGY
jgi:hypothetical protein